LDIATARGYQDPAALAEPKVYSLTFAANSRPGNCVNNPAVAMLVVENLRKSRLVNPSSFYFY